MATLGWVRTSPTVKIDASEHRTGSADHMRRWNHRGTLAAGPWGRPRKNGSSIRLTSLCSHRRRSQTEATVLVRWYRWPLLSIGEADPTLLGGGTGPGWVSTARVAARGRCDGGPQPASTGASKNQPRRALLSTYLSLRWSPSVAGGAAITGALLAVMPTQWRVEWTALAGCGWRYPSLGAMSDRRPRAHVQVNCIHIP